MKKGYAAITEEGIVVTATVSMGLGRLLINIWADLKEEMSQPQMHTEEQSSRRREPQLWKPEVATYLVYLWSSLGQKSDGHLGGGARECNPAKRPALDFLPMLHGEVIEWVILSRPVTWWQRQWAENVEEGKLKALI